MTSQHDGRTEAASTREARPWRRAALLVAAGVVAAALAAPASAQYRQDGGRALDANPRAGSGGRNDEPGSNAGTGPGRSPLVTGNQIVTGNVTAGRQFRDRVGYTDPSEFRDITSSSFSSDRFVRDSAGVPQRVGGIPTQIDLSQPQAYYGSERVAPPPPGYIPAGSGTGSYVATAGAFVNDLRNRTLNLGLESTARPAELILSTFDHTNQPALLTASPLQGVRVWDTGQNISNLLITGTTGQLRPLEGPMDRFGSDPNSILRMRDELNRLAGGEQGQGQGQDQGHGPGQGAGQQGGLVKPLDTSLGAPNNGNNGNTGAGGNVPGQNQGNAIPANGLSTPIGANVIGGESGQTNQSLRNRLVLAPADKQTPQLADLRRQYEQRHGAGTDVEANREFNLEVRTKREGEAKAKAQAAQPGQESGRRQGGGTGARRGQAGADTSKPGATEPSPSPAPAPAPAPTPAEENAPSTAPETKPAEAAKTPIAIDVPAGPVRINSLADRVQAKGLRDLLTSAEDLMRQEKYAAALDKYNTALEVAPNNALLRVGRAHAELAASYYRRAEADLRDALAQAPEVAEAQFDLKGLIGADRLQVIVKDLKDLVDTDKTQPRPLLLLAYIAYHTENPEQVSTYLEAAQQRVQGDDALIKAWKQAWNLPKSRGAAQDLNK